MQRLTRPRTSPILPTEASVWSILAKEIDSLAESNRVLAGRCHRLQELVLHLGEQRDIRRKLLAYLLREGYSGEPTFERVEQIVSGGSRSEDAQKPLTIRRETDALRLTPPSRECLRKISDGVVCPYIVDVRSNTITYRKEKDRCYQIPRGDASHVVNMLVRGMLNGIRKKRSWLVRFTRKEEKILHRNGDGTKFYKECVVRTILKGDGNQKFGETARLRE